jgi:hypothetical protein
MTAYVDVACGQPIKPTVLVLPRRSHHNVLDSVSYMLVDAVNAKYTWGPKHAKATTLQVVAMIFAKTAFSMVLTA